MKRSVLQWHIKEFCYSAEHCIGVVEVRPFINGVLKHTFFLRSMPYGMITLPDKPAYPDEKVSIYTQKIKTWIKCCIISLMRLNNFIKMYYVCQLMKEKNSIKLKLCLLIFVIQDVIFFLCSIKKFTILNSIKQNHNMNITIVNHYYGNLSKHC